MSEEELYRLQKQVKAVYRRIQREQPAIEGVSQSALQVLTALSRAGRPLRPGELAGELEMATSNVAAALRSLEAADLAVREPDPRDGRKAQVSLTPAGATLIAAARRDRHAWLRQAAAGALTAGEQRLLLRAGDLMQRLADWPGLRSTAGVARVAAVARAIYRDHEGFYVL